MHHLQTFATQVDTVGDVSDKNLTGNVKDIINAVIGVLGLVAVIVIIVGGINYMTSNGDAGKVKKAKDTILYGVIGLIICALSFAIANFVIGIINNSANSDTSYTNEITPDEIGYTWNSTSNFYG